jgi:two-component SAPR family response regulator
MLKIMIVEDEENALDMMEILLTEIGGVEILGKYSNPFQALEEVKNKNPQAIFMDIEMPGISGLELASRILEGNDTIKIVFVTAYRQYAIDAFELESVDYVLKPVTKSRLEKAVERLKKMVKSVEIPIPRAENEIRLLVNCFNRFEAVFEGQTEPLRWKTVKVKELFAFLIHHLDQRILRDEIIETLFPDEDFSRAKINFHTCMSYLKKCLSEGGLHMAVTFSENCYRLSGSHIVVDMLRFREILQSFKIIHNGNISLFQEIEALYQGDYLEKNGYGWAEERREALRLEYVRLASGLAEYFKKLGNISAAEKYYLRILEKSPYSEETLFGLLTIQRDSEKRPEAIQLYQVFTERLMKDIGIKPGTKLRELYESMIE